LGRQICTVCCGTKRLVEINCPADCSWLASAREHPPAAVVRQQQHDLSRLLPMVQDMSERQQQLFLLIGRFLVAYEAPELQPLVDDDVVDALAAMAATFETASRGVIYDHRPASLSGERLAGALKPMLAEAGRGAGSAFERDAALVMRRIADGVRELRATASDGRRLLLDLLARTIATPQPVGSETHAAADAPQAPPPRLIIP
jgi:hypothetical protein